MDQRLSPPKRVASFPHVPFPSLGYDTLATEPQSQMDCPDKELRFVQFPHPGWEHEPDDPNGKGRSWHKTYRKLENGECVWNSHKRKFMRLRGGQWIDEEWCKHIDDLYAWGEWEPESILVPGFNPPKDDPLAPRYLWDPYWVRKKDYSGLHNTDPFIFGERFLYSNCYQPRIRRLRALAPGSLIMFGSCKQDGGEWKWMLDTVFVVRDSFPYDPRNPRPDLEGKVSETFLEVTGGPLSSNPLPPDVEKFRLYRGVTPDEHEEFGGMFSFFPAKPAGDHSAFRRPFIKLPQSFFTSGNLQSPRITEVDRLCELRELWDSIVAQVRAAGLVLGTHTDLPPERPEEP